MSQEIHNLSPSNSDDSISMNDCCYRYWFSEIVFMFSSILPFVRGLVKTKIALKSIYRWEWEEWKWKNSSFDNNDRFSKARLERDDSEGGTTLRDINYEKLIENWAIMKMDDLLLVHNFAHRLLRTVVKNFPLWVESHNEHVLTSSIFGLHSAILPCRRMTVVIFEGYSLRQ